MLVQPCVQNVLGKIGEVSLLGYSLHPQESGPDSSKDHMEWLHLRPCVVLYWYGASRTIWDCYWSWGIVGLPRVAAPAALPKGKPGTKMNEWVCRPTFKLSIYEIVFSLFAKSECLIQINKHIWMETCVFVEIC